MSGAKHSADDQRQVVGRIRRHFYELISNTNCTSSFLGHFEGVLKKPDWIAINSTSNQMMRSSLFYIALLSCKLKSFHELLIRSLSSTHQLAAYNILTSISSKPSFDLPSPIPSQSSNVCVRKRRSSEDDSDTTIDITLPSTSLQNPRKKAKLSELFLQADLEAMDLLILSNLENVIITCVSNTVHLDERQVKKRIALLDALLTHEDGLKGQEGFKPSTPLMLRNVNIAILKYLVLRDPNSTLYRGTLRSNFLHFVSLYLTAGEYHELVELCLEGEHGTTLMRQQNIQCETPIHRAIVSEEMDVRPETLQLWYKKGIPLGSTEELYSMLIRVVMSGKATHFVEMIIERFVQDLKQFQVVGPTTANELLHLDDVSGITLLHSAIIKVLGNGSQLAIVKLLLDKYDFREDLKHTGPFRTLIHACVKHTLDNSLDELEERKAIIKCFLEVDPSLLDEVDGSDDLTPLLSSKIHLELVKLLVKLGADLRKVTKVAGFNILHQSLDYLDLDGFKQLVKFVRETLRYDVMRMKSADGWTPLFMAMAVLEVDEETIRDFAYAGVNLHELDEKGENVLLGVARKAGRSQEYSDTLRGVIGN